MLVIRPEWICWSDLRPILPNMLCGKLAKPGLLLAGAGILQFRAFLPICVLVLEHTLFKSN